MGHLTSTVKVCLMFDSTLPLRLIQTSLIYKKIPLGKLITIHWLPYFS